MNKTYLVIGISVAVLVIILGWAFVVSSQPLPGVEELQDGRNHAVEGTPLTYKFNPPTSGDHYPSWITKGFYDEPRPDGNVVHSQEHGYVIFWYDCEAKLSSFNLIQSVYAQTATDSTQPTPASVPMTAGSEGSPSATLKDMPKAFSDGSCNSLKDQIKQAMNDNGMHKLIAMPRPHMGTPLVLTAWGRALKLNKVDKDQIKRFIDAYRDHGPEQTDEP